MFILRIEHSVQDFNGWKKLFDSDPIERKQSGVRRYRISRPVDNDNFVMIDLEFDTESQAESTLASLQKVWGRVEGNLMSGAQTRIVKSIETGEL